MPFRRRPLPDFSFIAIHLRRLAGATLDLLSSALDGASRALLRASVAVSRAGDRVRGG